MHDYYSNAFDLLGSWPGVQEMHRVKHAALLALLTVAALYIPNALAADDPQAQIEFLQNAVQFCQQKRNEANDTELSTATKLLVEIRRLQKRIAELEEAGKKARTAQ